MKRINFFVGLITLMFLTGCATINVTKTAKGYYEPTDPDNVEILVTVPGKPFIELATVSTQKWKTSATAKMHNSLRAKCAPLGANAVILKDSGIDYDGYYWATGVAIRYK